MKPIQVVIVFAALILLVACGGSGKNAVTISLSPAAVSVPTTQNTQFAATVMNGSTTAVNWEVNGILFGDITTIGSITSAGLYTAPQAIPNPATVTITAVPVADTTKSATATVTITLGANLAITPSSLTMAAGAQQQFNVTSNGSAATGIVFSLSCKSTATGACGSVTSGGLYTAPLSPPPNGNVILTANSTVSGSSFSTSATITIQGSAQSLTGQYAFSMAGVNAGANFHSAGSIAFDGNGTITGGSENVNSNGTVTVVNITGGTYTYSTAQGRVTANVVTDHGNVTWYLVLASRNHGFIEFGGSGISASGTVDLQDTTQFNAAAVNGHYTFLLSGLNASSKQVAVIGSLAADGAGNIASGFLDANDGGSLSTAQSVSGSLTTPNAGSGSGTLTLNSGFGAQTFAYYIVDATHLKLVETDANRSTAGDALLQANSPYASGDFHGSLFFVMSGTSANGQLGIGGSVAIGSGAITGGSIDKNDPAGPVLAQSVTGGSYTVQDSTTGRTTATISLNGTSINVVLYPLSDTSFNMLETDTNQVSSGSAAIGTGGNGSNSTISGNYALNLSGVVGTTPEEVVGQLVANGGGVFTGTLDITNGGANTALLASPYAVAGTPNTTLKSNFANLGSVGFNLYIVDSTQVFLLENDNKGVLTGVVRLQN